MAVACVRGLTGAVVCSLNYHSGLERVSAQGSSHEGLQKTNAFVGAKHCIPKQRLGKK